MLLVRLAALGLLALTACTSSKDAARSRLGDARAVSQHGEPPYGFSPENPIRVGGGPEGEHAFLEALRGPQGEPVAWRRLGSCCEFPTPNGLMGMGLLDMYEVIHEGMDQPIILYLDMYDTAPVSAPHGFSLDLEVAGEEAPRAKPRVIEL